MDTCISIKGQVVIPVAIRRKYGLHPGTVLHVVDTGNGILLKPVTEKSVDELRGILKGSGITKALLEDREAEFKREGNL